MRNGSGAARIRLQSALCGNNLFQNSIERASNTPIWIVRAEFGQVRDVTDVVALAVLVDILPVHLLATHPLEFGDGFEHGNAVLAAAAEVVDLSAARTCRKFLDRTHYVVAMNIVADLLALVAENGIGATGNRHFHEVGKKTVKFDARMRRPGEASPAENADFHTEVAAVFLGHQVCGRFRRAKERMKRPVDAAIFVDAFVVLGAGVLPAGLQLFQGNFIGGIAINFVGADEDEDGLGAVQAGGFEEIDGAEGVDFEIEDGDVAGLIVGGLRSAVNDQVEGVRAEKFFEGKAVADVQIEVRKIPGDAAEALEIPGGVAGLAEENAAHVVVDANDGMTLAVKMFHGLRTDQPAGAGDEYCLDG